MAASQTTIEAELAELVEQSLATFCEETGAMFDWEMESEQKDVCIQTVKGLRKHFKKLVAVYEVQSEGALNGTFHILFDRDGLFTLGGMIVMLPENRIIENRKHGTAKEAGEISDAVKEAGNMLIGSLDKVFRDDLTDHGHLLHTNTFIGEPWNQSDEQLGMGADEECVLVACEMKIESYPAFRCGVTFPKSIYGPMAERDGEQPAALEAERPVDAEQQDQTVQIDNVDSSTERGIEPKSNIEQPDAEEPKHPADTEQQNQKEKSEKDDSTPEQEAEVRDESEKPEADTVSSPAEQASIGKEESPAQTIKSDKTQELSKTKNAHSTPEQGAEVKDVSEDSGAQADSPSVEKASAAKEEQPAQAVGADTKQEPSKDAVGALPSLRANDIMRKNILWCSSEEGMGEVLAKMCQDGINYALVGPEGTLEGIVSMSDLRAGMSPYLRPEFAQWRRPVDDASLRIKVGLLMSKNVHTVKSQEGLSEVVARMCRLGLRSMPVVNSEGQIEGIVNVFDVLRTLSHADTKVSSEHSC